MKTKKCGNRNSKHLIWIVSCSISLNSHFNICSSKSQRIKKIKVPSAKSIRMFNVLTFRIIYLKMSSTLNQPLWNEYAFKNISNFLCLKQIENLLKFIFHIMGRIYVELWAITVCQPFFKSFNPKQFNGNLHKINLDPATKIIWFNALAATLHMVRFRECCNK